jgi:hypothetical protein
MIRHIVYTLITLPIAAFFAFVGYHKAFSSMADLARYGAYTAHLPEWIGRILGWAEIASTLALLAGINPQWRSRLVPPAGWFIILSQVVSSFIHIQHDEMSALPQNAVIALAAAVLIWISKSGRQVGPLHP